MEIFGKFATSVEMKLDTMAELLHKTNEGEKAKVNASNAKKKKDTKPQTKISL